MTDEKKNPIEKLATGEVPNPPGPSPQEGETPKIKGRGKAGIATTLYIVPRDRLVSQKAVLDVLIQECAHIINLAAWEPSWGNRLIAQIQEVLDPYLDFIAANLMDEKGPEDAPPAV